MPRFPRISNPLDQLPDLLKLLVETQVKQPVDDAVWAFTNPIDRLMGRGRAAGGQMAFPFGGRGKFKVEPLPNGFTRVDDRESGLVALFDSRSGQHHSGPRLFNNLREIPKEPIGPPNKPQMYSAHAGGRDFSRKGFSGREHHGYYGSEREARKAVEDLKRMGVPTSVRKRKPKKSRESKPGGRGGV